MLIRCKYIIAMYWSVLHIAGKLVTLGGRIYTNNVDNVEEDVIISRYVCTCMWCGVRKVLLKYWAFLNDMSHKISITINCISNCSNRIFVGDEICDPIDFETGQPWVTFDYVVSF